MTVNSFTVSISFTIYLSFICQPCDGFEVMQPPQRTVNPDRSASISCEHTARVSSVEDVRLNSISPTGKSSVLCQKGMKDCRNILMHPENPNKYIFIILNIEPEALNSTYECEVTVNNNDVDDTKKGTPTRLLQGQKETAERCVPPSPLPPQTHPLRWILTGLLGLMFLYSCVITFFYIRMKVLFQESSTERDNSTYVEMRTAPLQRY